MRVGSKKSDKVNVMGNKILFPNTAYGNKFQTRDVVSSGSSAQHSDIFQNKSNRSDLAYIPTGLKSGHHSKTKSSLEK